MAELSTRYGLLSAPNCAEDVIVGFLRRYGEWAWDEVCFIADNLAEGARVADIGAFVGTFGLGLAQQRRLGFLCLVEPNPEIVPLLSENIARNCQTPAEVVAAAIAPNAYELSDGVHDRGNLGSLSYASRPHHPNERVIGAPAKRMALGELRALFGEFDLIKIDAEGLELAIVRSELPALLAARTVLWMEANENPDTVELGAALIEAGFRLHYFAFSSFNPNNFLGGSNPIYPFAYEAGLYATSGAPPVLSEPVRAHSPIFKPISSRDEIAQALWVTPRWGMAQWVGRSMPEVVALAGRELLGETFDGFLRSSATRTPRVLPVTELKERIAQIEHALHRSESLAIERLVQLRRVDEQLGAAASIALERSALIGLERDRVRERDAQIKVLQRYLEAAAHDTANQRQVHEVILGELNGAREWARALEAELHRVQDEHGRLQGEHGRLQHEQQATALRAEALAHALWAMESSSIWRATGLLRRLLSRYPRFKTVVRSLSRSAYRFVSVATKS